MTVLLLFYKLVGAISSLAPRDWLIHKGTSQTPHQTPSHSHRAVQFYVCITHQGK